MSTTNTLTTLQHEVLGMKLDYLKSIYRLYEKPEVPPSERLRMYHKMTGGALAYCLRSIVVREKVNETTSRYIPIIRECLTTIKQLEAEDDERAALGISDDDDDDMMESIETDDEKLMVKQEKVTVAIKQEDTAEGDITMEDIPGFQIKRERSSTVGIKREPWEE